MVHKSLQKARGVLRRMLPGSARTFLGEPSAKWRAESFQNVHRVPAEWYTNVCRMPTESVRRTSADLCLENGTQFCEQDCRKSAKKFSQIDTKWRALLREIPKMGEKSLQRSAQNVHRMTGCKEWCTTLRESSQDGGEKVSRSRPARPAGPFLSAWFSPRQAYSPSGFF